MTTSHSNFILAAKGGTGIPACASAASQTKMSVAQWEREIDQRVYRLYGLTVAEIKVVEDEGVVQTEATA